MASLADLPELVGFFSYSRDDDEDSHGALSALRDRIQRELRGQLGRSTRTFRLWQDKEAIPSGTLWETEIKNAVAQSVFFIPIITPTVVQSHYCRFELEAFLEREAALDRADLVFPVLYIRVPGLEDEARQKSDPVLSIVGKRQYLDWREFRHHDVNSREVKETIERFCQNICDALYRSWLSPDERKKLEEAAARERIEAEHVSQQAEAKRQEEEQRKRAEALALARAEKEKRQRAVEAERQKAEAERLRAEEEAKRHVREERLKAELEAKRRAEAEALRLKAEAKRTEQQRVLADAKAKRRAEAGDRRRALIAKMRSVGPPSRGALFLFGLVTAALLIAAAALWIVASPRSTDGLSVACPPSSNSQAASNPAPVPPPSAATTNGPQPSGKFTKTGRPILDFGANQASPNPAPPPTPSATETIQPSGRFTPSGRPILKFGQ